MTRVTGLSAEQMVIMAELLPSIDSLRDLAGILGVDPSVIRRAAAPCIASLREDGLLQNCGCGQRKFHPRGCIARGSKRWNATPGVLDKRNVVTSLMRDGATYETIANVVGISRRQVREYIRWLTPDERARREELNKVRNKGGGSRGRRRQEEAAA